MQQNGRPRSYQPKSRPWRPMLNGGRLLWLLYFAAVRRIARMGSMQRELSWPYEGDVFPQGLLAIIQRTVSAREFPTLTVIHDDEDDWLVSDGVHDPNGGASSVHHLQNVVNSDPSLAEL